MRFEGTAAYVATEDLKVAVNAAIALERPLLVKGEPGTGKTVLAIEIAKAVGAPLIEWHIRHVPDRNTSRPRRCTLVVGSRAGCRWDWSHALNCAAGSAITDSRI